MRAMCVTEYGQPLQLMELPTPSPPPGYALLQVLTCGLCFSDVKTVRGHMPYSPGLRLPHVAGHEVCGRVVEVNGPSSRISVGDRVVTYHVWGCRECASCRRGEEQICLNPRAWMGFTHPGGFQEFLAVPVEYLLPVPERLPDHLAPALTCALGTAYRAVVSRGATAPGERVLVLGLGGVGLHAALIAQALGARTMGVEATEQKALAAQKSGVHEVTFGSNVRDLVTEQTNGEMADVVIETTGVPALLEQARLMCRPGGRIVSVGYHVGEMMATSSDQLVLLEQSVLGSRYASREDMERGIRMVADGLFTPVVDEVLDLEDVNSAIGKLEAGTVNGRLALTVAR